jgi:hypothetical protein
MSIRHVVTRGYGNGTFSGTIGDVVLRGYSLGAAVAAAAAGALFRGRGRNRSIGKGA